MRGEPTLCVRREQALTSGAVNCILELGAANEPDQGLRFFVVHNGEALEFIAVEKELGILDGKVCGRQKDGFVGHCV
jgi:D-lyxose ketol-isomerase